MHIANAWWRFHSMLTAFASAGSGNPYPSGGGSPYGAGGHPPRKIPNYLVQSILVTLCCCLPFGIVAIVFAAQVDSKATSGDIAGAMKSSETAKMWCWVAFGVGLVVNLIVVGIQVIAILAGVQMNAP